MICASTGIVQSAHAYCGYLGWFGLGLLMLGLVCGLLYWHFECRGDQTVFSPTLTSILLGSGVIILSLYMLSSQLVRAFESLSLRFF